MFVAGGFRSQLKRQCNCIEKQRIWSVTSEPVGQIRSAKSAFVRSHKSALLNDAHPIGRESRANTRPILGTILEIRCGTC